MRLGKVRITVIGAIVALLVIAVVMWLFVLSPRLAEASRLQEQATQLQTANLSLLNQQNQVREQVQQAPEAAAQAQRLFETMPQEADLPRVIEQITQAAVDAGIDESGLQTVNTTLPAPVAVAGAADTTGVDLASLVLQVTATGKREQALAFIENLQALDRALLVTSTSLNAGAQDGGPDQIVQVEGSLFVLQSKLPDLVAEVERLIAEAESGQPTSAADTAEPAADAGTATG